MPFGREQFTIETDINGEVINKIYAVELKPVPMEEFQKLTEEEQKLCKPYPFNPHIYEAAPGIMCEQDVGVPMRDGAILYADIFRPADSGPDNPVPAILAWSNYGKRPNEYRPAELVGFTPGVPQGAISEMSKFEAADPAASGTPMATTSSLANKMPKMAMISSNGRPSSLGVTDASLWLDHRLWQ